MPRRILLLEPNYKNKYPPIGLMKIATYHKLQKDKVTFYKGELNELLVNLKLEECIRELRKVDRRINWRSKAIIIKKYIASRHTKYIEELAGVTNINQISQIAEVLKFHSKNVPKNKWDRIYVTTLFTFYWEITIKTIEFAKSLVDEKDNVLVGGVMASLLKNEIFEVTGIMPVAGLLDQAGMLDEGNTLIVDDLPLDYSILEEIDYKYPTQSAYFTYMTKGCTRKCAFCSVPKLEPTYKDKVEATEKFKVVNKKFGEQRNLLLMDNNVLASPKFPEIIQEIKDMGFYVGAFFAEPNQLAIAIRNIRDGYNTKAYMRKAVNLIQRLRSRLNGIELEKYDRCLKRHKIINEGPPTKENLLKAYKEVKLVYEKYRAKTHLVRYVDFNQGTDARYVTEENMKLMSEIPIKPLRIAFDHIGIKNTYIKAVELAAKFGIKNLSNYILYNFLDTPEEFYERLKINVELGKRLKIKIFSFPMKYIPLFGEEAKHRRYIGKNWNRKYIRAIQAILNATKGIVAPGYDFFHMAFGLTLEEFLELLLMPEAYIINRVYFKNNGMIQRWRDDFEALDELEKIEAKEIIDLNDFQDIESKTKNISILRLLSHYVFIKGKRHVIDSRVKRLRAKFNNLIRTDVFFDLTLTHDFDSKFKNRIAM